MGDLPHTTANPVPSRPSGPGEGAGTPTTRHRDGPADPSREPPALQYLRLLWDRRRLILGGSLLPAVLVALVLHLWPGKYTTTFFYERPLTESDYSVLQRRFFSQENLDKIIGRLQEQGLTRFAGRLDRARALQSFDKLIRFEVAPTYPKRLPTTDPCTSEKISAFKTKLLSLEVFGASPEEVAGVSAVVTGNIETILPLYDIRNHLKESLGKLRGDAAKIEEDRFRLTMDLQKEKAKLEQLKAADGDPGTAGQGGVVLQFNVDRGRDALPSFARVRTAPPKSAERQETLAPAADKYDYYEFLPLPYQVRAAQSKIIDLQETLRGDIQKRDFYVQATELDQRLLAKIEESLLIYYTAPQYLGYLGEQLPACKDPMVADYLRSCVRKMENLVLVNTRAGEKPVVHPVSKEISRSSALTFVLGLMATGFAAVLLGHRYVYAPEGLPPRRAVRDDGLRTPGESPG